MSKRPRLELTRKDHFVLGFVIKAAIAVLLRPYRRTPVLRRIERGLHKYLGELRCELDNHICAENRMATDTNAYYGAYNVPDVLAADEDARAALAEVLGFVREHYGLNLVLVEDDPRESEGASQ